MALSASKTQLIDRFNAASKRVQEHFKHLPALTQDFPVSVAVSYAFDRVAVAHNTTIVAGLVKKYRLNKDVAREIADFQRGSWDEFHYEYQTVFGSVIPDEISDQFAAAEMKRDHLLSGKRVSSTEQGAAVELLLAYADTLDAFVAKDAKLHPFSDLTGVKSRSTPLDKTTSRWILKGMGFPLM